MSTSVSYITRSGALTEKNDITKEVYSKYTNNFTVGNTTKQSVINNNGIVPRKKLSKFGSTKKSKNYFNSSPWSISVDTVVNNLNKSLYIPNSSDTVYKSLSKYSQYYNRYKLPNPNNALQKGFAHVFFVRPSCNILNSNYELKSSLKNNEIFSYANKSAKWLLKELVANNGQTHDFMMLLSNYVTSFSLSDEYINSDSYGKTYTGYKISYGKSNIESKTAGSFTVSFRDDRDLHIYQLHKLWVEYINGVYRGTIAPLTNNIKKKILDYVGSCYYILTAEDGETIIFWSKYYGIFPTDIPSSQYSWGAGNVIENPSLDIKYNFSFKEDFNPYTILEFNYNSRCDTNGVQYVPIYDSKLGFAANTMVGAPFIELKTSNDGSCPYVLKLRFRSS